MILRYITASDPREDTSIEDIIKLLNTSKLAELGIQAHPSAMSAGYPRYIWFNNLLDVLKRAKQKYNIALHINYRWCDSMCGGVIPVEIKHLLSQTHMETQKPLIQRVQLNIGDDTYKFKADAVAKIISENKKHEFIFPYNKATKRTIDKLEKTSAKFNLLFDGSYGAGISPKSWQKPAKQDIQFGYAGGISPENVSDNLTKISQILPEDYKTWIDAEGRLRNPNTCTFDVNYAQNYLDNAIKWIKQNKR